VERWQKENVMKLTNPRSFGIALAIVLVPALAATSAPAQTFKSLFTFANQAQGEFPASALIRDAKGDLYGTTYAGGSGNCSGGCGVAFKLDKAGQQTVLYSFSGTAGDGATPDGALVLDAAGNLYGTTLYGGSSGYGTVYKLSKSGKETVLYSFSGSKEDGQFPMAGLVRDAAGNLYGTTLYSGGAGCNHGAGPGCGTVFKLDKAGRETALYRFTGVAGDGSFPVAGLVRDPAGNLYGTTQGGGSGFGTVFKLDKTGKETVLYSFTGGADGRYPQYGYLLRDAAGNLYGTTSSGGSSNCSGGCGVVFKVDKARNETVLYSFTETNGDGANPYAGVTRDSAGNLYGTTFNGGVFSVGTVFKLDKAGQETVLHNFGRSDGANPRAAVVHDARGNLYGATQYGGTDDFGTIFKLTP
jgi:uncharacterized repeat protein (TIGR03803 family)